MAKKKPVKVNGEHGLTAEQFAEWELMEVTLEVYKDLKKLK